MRFLIKSALLSGALMTTALSALQVTLETPPVHPRQNRAIRLTLSSDRKIDRIEFPSIPGAQWLKNRVETSQQWINGRSSYARTLFLIPAQTGTLKVPSFTVYSGKEKAQTRPLELNVLAAETKVEEKDSQGIDISEVVWGRITLTPNRRTFFTGEKVHLKLDLFIRERFQRSIRLEHYPEVTGTAGALWDSYTLPQQGKSRFRVSQPAVVVEKEVPCIRYTFSGAFRVMKPETLRIAANIRIGVLQQQRRSSDPFDDMFSFGMDSFFGSTFAPYTVRIAPLPAIETVSLPTPPDGVLNTGLIGSYDLSGKMTSGTLHTGEITEFLLQIKGSAPVDGFLAPELKVPGFRVYPPEVKKDGNTLTAKYAMIPLEAGQKDFELRFGFFDPEKKKYSVSPVKIQTAVVQGSAKNTPAPVISSEIRSAGVQDSAAPPAKERQDDELFYQKSAPGKAVKVPLIDNYLPWIVLLFAAAPALALLLEMRLRRKMKADADPAFQRKAELHGESAKLIRALKNGPDCEYIRTAVLPKLGEAMGLSAGITAQDAAEKCADPELKRFFMELDSSGFQPGGASGDREKVPPEICRELIRLIRKVMLWLCLASVLLLNAAVPDFNADFNSGDYRKAARTYQQMVKTPSGIRPDVLFNLGNAEFRLGNLPMARLYLVQASLLKPNDPEIRGNLAVVDAKLMHSAPETATLHGMIVNLRDHLRPDHYLLIIAILWAFFWMLWAFRRKISPTLFWSTAGILFLLAVFSAGAFTAQMNSLYSADRLIVTAPEIRLRSLPGVLSGKNEAVIPGGGDAERLPYQAQGFVRIRINGQEGWVPESQVAPLLPGGIF